MTRRVPTSLPSCTPFDRDLTMRRYRPESAARRPSPALPMPRPVQALVDEFSDLLALAEPAGSLKVRPDEFARPSWCTHEGVTVNRVGRRACLRCGAVLGPVRADS